MFPDSENAKQFQMGETKANYLISLGLAPYVKDRLSNVLNETKFKVTSFDESHIFQ